jgi:signal transduction histidine kinase
MFGLRPPLLEAAGLKAALHALAEELCSEGDLRCHMNASAERYPWAIEELVFRGVREALINVRKHANAADVWITVTTDSRFLHALVRDNGGGFDTELALDPARRRLHLGFDVIAERLRLAGGELSIKSAPGHGASVMMQVPLPDDRSLAHAEPRQPGQP